MTSGANTGPDGGRNVKGRSPEQLAAANILSWDLCSELYSEFSGHSSLWKFPVPDPNTGADIGKGGPAATFLLESQAEDCILLLKHSGLKKGAKGKAGTEQFSLLIPAWPTFCTCWLSR
nr:hypothetical protein BaRGS_009386 [Batillaria attramentaria]